ncbi:MAG: flagellin N-terminal helical domain-containing protein [Planctomycetota bacterium]|jgi:flagellin-like hook-associated protein FlgL
MNSISSVIGRVPNLLSSQMMVGSINRSNSQLLQLQMQLASGRAVNRASEDPVASGTISVLDDLVERREQRVRNLSEAGSLLGTIDAALSEMGDLLLEAKSVGLSQIGLGSDTQTRRNQALVIDSILEGMQSLGNREYRGMYLFGGSEVGTRPFDGLLGGIQYAGSGDGMITDLGLGSSTPVTLAGDRAFGALSARIEGDRDLDPGVTGDTLLANLNGGRGLGIAAGPLTLTVNAIQVDLDLGDAITVEDVRTSLQDAIQTVDPGAIVDIDPATGNRFRITPSVGMDVDIADPIEGTTAADLGLTGTYNGGASTSGADLAPRLTWNTRMDALDGVSTPLGSLRIENAGQVRVVDLSGVTTIGDLRDTVELLDIGVRIELGATGDRIAVKNELSGGAMSISEVGGGVTATELGIRNFSADTLLSDFNDGRGVAIRSGSVDPISGNLDPDADVDFTVSLHDGRSFDVDLAGAETVQDVLDAIKAAAGGIGLAVPGEFDAGLATDGNGIEFTDLTVGGDDLSIERRNNSTAAADLGIQGSTAGATLAGTDRATVAVDGVFGHLKALRDALYADDESGIAFAVQRLEADIARSTEARAEVGVRARRVEDATVREEDLQVQDLSLKSTLQDLDFTDAAIRFSQLQQQLQAGLSTAGRITSLTLLDYLR